MMRLAALLLIGASSLAAQFFPFPGPGRRSQAASACPAPAWQMNLAAGSATYSGTDGSGTIVLNTLGGTTLVEDPTSSGIYALDHDGNNDDWRGGTGIDNLPAGAGFTVEGWIRPDISQGGTITGKMDTVGNTSIFSWRLNQGVNDNIVLAIQNTSSANEAFATDTDSLDPYIGQTTYLHVMAKVSGCTGMACNSAQIYFNGSPVTTTLTADQTGTLRDDSAWSVMGGVLASGASDYDGRMSGVRIYSSAVSDACALERYETRAGASLQDVTTSNCSPLCESIWAIAGTSEPFEVAANSSQMEVGDACRCLSGPGPKLRLDGSETP